MWVARRGGASLLGARRWGVEVGRRRMCGGLGGFLMWICLLAWGRFGASWWVVGLWLGRRDLEIHWGCAWSSGSRETACASWCFLGESREMTSRRSVSWFE